MYSIPPPLGFSHSLKTRLPLELSAFFTFSTKNLEKIKKLIIFQALGRPGTAAVFQTTKILWKYRTGKKWIRPDPDPGHF